MGCNVVVHTQFVTHEKKKKIHTHIHTHSTCSIGNLFCHDYSRCVYDVRVCFFVLHFFHILYYRIDIRLLFGPFAFISFSFWLAGGFCETFMTVFTLWSLFSFTLCSISIVIRSIRLFTFYGNQIGTTECGMDECVCVCVYVWIMEMETENQINLYSSPIPFVFIQVAINQNICY